MHFSTGLVALAALLTNAVYGHMIMKTPTPYSAQSIDSSPLSGANYPCKLTGDPSTFYARNSITKMAIGEEQTFGGTGSAVHGGGSCQFAITSDLQPSKSSHWQVITSIEGGCPATDGVNPSEYTFKIPDGIAPGQYSFAWTWMPVLSGGPEFYMNCAAIEVTAGKSKRSLNESMEIDSLVKRDGLPDLFVANLAGINDCKTPANGDALFPNPGPNVQKPEGGKRNYMEVTGTNCCPEGKCVGSTGGSSGNPSSSPASSSGSGKAGAAPSSAPASSQAPSSAAGALSVLPFTATGAPLSSSAAAFTNKTSSPTGFVTSVIATSANPAASSAPKSAAASAVATGSASSSSSGSSSSTGGLSGPCTSEGMFNCDGKSYQQCASGAWTAMRPLAAGVSCKQGQSMTLWRRKAF